jgi:outer membrane protein TolC
MKRGQRATAAALLLAILGGGKRDAGAAGEVQAPSEGEVLTLEQAIERAQRRDERIGMADLQVTLAQHNRTRALTVLGPQASLLGTILFQPEQSFTTTVDPSQPPQNFVVTPSPQYQFVAQINQPLYVQEYFGRRESGTRATEQATALGHRTREQVAMDTTTAYYEVLKDDRRVLLARTSVDRANAQVVLARARVQAGAALKTALLQAQIDLDRYNRQVLDADGTRRVARDLLARLTGAALEVQLADPALQQPGVGDLEGAVALAEKGRSDLRAAQKAVEAADADLSATRARLYPYLSVGGTYIYTSPTTIFQPRADIWRVVLTATVPLFQSGREYLDVRDKESALGNAELGRDQLRKQIRNEVTRAWVTFETARRQVEVGERQVSFARENHVLVVNQFRGGTATSTDVTVAQAALNEAELNLVVAQYDREVAAAAVRFATGTK